MMTPKEVQEHGFPQARKGYDMVEVDEFLDALTEDYTALFTNYGKLSNSYAKLKKKAQALAAALEQSQNSKAALQPVQQVAVVDTSAAQSAAEELLRAARKDAEAIRSGAEREREEIIAEATGYAAKYAEQLKDEVAAEEAKLAAAKQNTAEYISQAKILLARHAALLEEAPPEIEEADANLPDPQVAQPELAISDESEEEPTYGKLFVPGEEDDEYDTAALAAISDAMSHMVDDEPTVDFNAASMADEISRRINSLNYGEEMDSDGLDETRIMQAAKENGEDSLFDMISEGRESELEGEFDEE